MNIFQIFDEFQKAFFAASFLTFPLTFVIGLIAFYLAERFRRVRLEKENEQYNERKLKELSSTSEVTASHLERSPDIFEGFRHLEDFQILKETEGFSREQYEENFKIEEVGVARSMSMESDEGLGETGSLKQVGTLSLHYKINEKWDEIVMNYVAGTKIMIGKNREKCNVVLFFDKSVGDVHTSIEAKDNGFYITNESILKNTYVDGKKINGGKKLENGSQIKICSYSILVYID